MTNANMRWRLARGIVLSIAAAVLLLPCFLFIVLVVGKGPDEGVIDLIGGSLVMVAVYSLFVIPVLAVSVAIILLVVYFGLRAVNRLTPRAFQWTVAFTATITIAVVFKFGDARPSEWPALLLVFAAAWAIAWVFTRVAAPDVDDSSPRIG